MKYYFLHLSLTDSQPVIVDQLKSNGADLIQTSSGICLKTDKTMDGLKEALGTEFKGKIESIESKQVDSSDFSEDIKAFLNKAN